MFIQPLLYFLKRKKLFEHQLSLIEHYVDLIQNEIFTDLSAFKGDFNKYIEWIDKVIFFT